MRKVNLTNWQIWELRHSYFNSALMKELHSNEVAAKEAETEEFPDCDDNPIARLALLQILTKPETYGDFDQEFTLRDLRDFLNRFIDNTESELSEMGLEDVTDEERQAEFDAIKQKNAEAEK